MLGVDAALYILDEAQELTRGEMLPEICSQCHRPYEVCAHCGDKIIFVPKQGFGNLGEWRHLEPPKNTVGHHVPHPKLHIT